MCLVCDPKDVLDISNYISREDEKDFYAGRSCEIELCWNYFVQNYDCYLLYSEDARLNKNNFSNFYNINFSFKENGHLQDESRVFTIKRKKMCTLKGSNYNYISDHTGFALLFRSSGALELYYYDIEGKFTSYIKIPFFQLKYKCEMKLVNRTIWLVTEKKRSYFVDAISIRNEKEWYHITSTSTDQVELEHVESSYMVVNFTDDTVGLNCEVLYIDYSVLKINEASEIEFVELQRPRFFDDEINVDVIGIYKKTIILIDHVNRPENFYFLTYEGSHLRLCKRMNICETFELEKHGFKKLGAFFLFDHEIIPELGKMLIASGAIIFVIDVRTFEVVQALNISIVVEDDLYVWYSYSKNRRELIIWINQMDKKFVLRFSLIHDLSLKEQAINFVLNNFSTCKISKCSLPQSLLQEILSKKIY